MPRMRTGLLIIISIFLPSRFVRTGKRRGNQFRASRQEGRGQEGSGRRTLPLEGGAGNMSFVPLVTSVVKVGRGRGPQTPPGALRQAIAGWRWKPGLVQAAI